MFEELKRCPFCGAEAELVRNSGWSYFVRCINKQCAAKTRLYHENENGARLAWNRREGRTCRMEYDPVHCDYICTSCGERYETDMYISISGDDRRFIKQKRYCPNCGARVMDE